MRYADGREYRGQWAENKKHGYGTMTLANGDKIQGQWTLNLLNGMAIYTEANGDRGEEFYKDGTVEGVRKPLRRKGTPRRHRAARLIWWLWLTQHDTCSGIQQPPTLNRCSKPRSLRRGLMTATTKCASCVTLPSPWSIEYVLITHQIPHSHTLSLIELPASHCYWDWCILATPLPPLVRARFAPGYATRNSYTNHTNTRRSGLIFCGQCTSKKIAVPRMNFQEPIRVCDECYLMIATTIKVEKPPNWSVPSAATPTATRPAQ